MKDREIDNVILARAVEEAENVGLPGFADRFRELLLYAQSVGYFEKVLEISRRAQAAGTPFSRELEAARARGELPSTADLEAGTHVRMGTIN